MGSESLSVTNATNLFSVRPWVAGIAPGKDGAYSVCLSGGYEDDVDEGYALSVLFDICDPSAPDAYKPAAHTPVQAEGTSKEPKMHPRTYVVHCIRFPATNDTEEPVHS